LDRKLFPARHYLHSIGKTEMLLDGEGLEKVQRRAGAWILKMNKQKKKQEKILNCLHNSIGQKMLSYN
jgi:hypothetical protein